MKKKGRQNKTRSLRNKAKWPESHLRRKNENFWNAGWSSLIETDTA